MAPMATVTNDSDLVVNIYDPAENSHDRHLQRSAALSHAAKVAHARRLRARHPPHKGQYAFVHEGQQPSSTAIGNARRPVDSRIARTPAHGNSDPFDSMAVSITPEVSMLLHLWKTHAEENAVPATRWISETALRQDLQLDNKLHAKSLLLLCSALLSSRSPDRQDLRVRRLERKHDCIVSLKELIRSHSKNEELYIRGLSLIFMATVLSDEPSEAKLHAKRLYEALGKLSQTQLWDDQEQVIIMSRMYYYDQQCALFYMRPPVLDPNVPVQHWQPYLTPLHAWVQNQGFAPGAVRYPTFSKGLESLFGRLQEYVTIQCMQVPKLLGFMEGHAASCSIIESIELTSLFFNHLEFYQGQYQEGIDKAAQYRWQNEIILTLTALTFLVYARGGPTIFGLREQGAKVMGMLRGRLMECPSLSSSRDWSSPQVYEHAQLWALFAGAIWEWDSGMYSAGERWYADHLQQMIHALSVESWSHLAEIMGNFLWIPPSQDQDDASTRFFLSMDDGATETRSNHEPHTGAQFLRTLLLFGGKSFMDPSEL